MKFILIFLGILSSFIFEFNKVSLSNEVKSKAAHAFQHQDYLLSIRYYQELITTYKVKDEQLILNLAHAYFKIADLTSSAKYYKQLLPSRQKKIQSVVNHQLGVIAAYQGKNKLAIAYFKDAMKANYKNEDARYNYEIIYKQLKKEQPTASSKIHQQEVREEAPENANVDASSAGGNPGKEGETKDQQDGLSEPGKNSNLQPGVESMEETSVPQPDKKGDANDLMINEKGTEATNALKTIKFNQIHMTEARAKQLLEHMKQQEILLLQQLPRKQTENKQKSTQDW